MADGNGDRPDPSALLPSAGGGNGNGSDAATEAAPDPTPVLTGGARSLANLRPPWRPGQSGQSFGRNQYVGPKAEARRMTDALAEELWRKIPNDHPILKRVPHLKGKTLAHAVAYGQIMAGIKGKGDVIAIIFDRIDGRVAAAAGTPPDDREDASIPLPDRIADVLNRNGLAAVIPLVPKKS